MAALVYRPDLAGLVAVTAADLVVAGVYFLASFLAGPFADFITEAKARLPQTRTYRFTYLPAQGVATRELGEFKALLSGADTVVVCVANPGGAAFAEAVLEAGKQLYVVSSLSPTYSLAFSDTSTVVAVYSYARESFKAAFAVLSGDTQAPGRLPIGTSP